METTLGTPALADLIRQFRSDARLSQEGLAERAGVSARTVSDIECGVARSPRAITLSLLSEALGLDEPARERLRNAIRRTGGPAPDVAPQVVHDAARRSNLPLQVTSFVGRGREIAEIGALLDDHRAVTLAGLGGIGKTRMSLEVAATRADAYRHGACFVGLAPISDAALLPGAIAAALGVRLPAEGDPLTSLAAALAQKTVLLILDNCEHVLAAIASIASALLHACPGVRILATSRQRLRIAGEATFRVPPLGVPSEAAADALDAKTALDYESIALFVARARTVNGRYHLADRDVATVAHVCRKLDGIPLAIELAAGRLDVLSPEQLRQRLETRFRLLRRDERDVEPRQQTLRALIDWSYDLLTDVERAVFRRVGIFVDGFTLEAAEGVACGEGVHPDDVFDALASLVDKSLVVADIQEVRTRFRLLETIRAYALVRLDESSERARAADLHLAYFRRRAERTSADFAATGSDASFMTTLAHELEDLRAALAWALAGGDVVAGGALAAAIGHPWARLGLSAEGIARLEAFAAALDDADPKLLAHIWSAIAWLAGNSFRAVRGDEASARAVAYARTAGDADTLAAALGYASINAARQGRFEDARAALDEADLVAGPTPGAGQRLRQLELRGFVALLAGDVDAAANAYEAHRALRRRLGDEFGEASAAHQLAEVEHARGRTARAVELMREILPNATRLLGREQHAHALVNLAGYLLALDDVDGARIAASEALELLTGADPASPPVVHALEHISLALALSGEWEHAAQLRAFADAAHASLGVLREHTEQVTHERLSALLGERYTVDELTRLAATGAGFSAADVVEDVRELLRSTAR